MSNAALLIDHEGQIRELAVQEVRPVIEIAAWKPIKYLVAPDPETPYEPSYYIIRYRLDVLESEARGMLVYYQEPL